MSTTIRRYDIDWLRVIAIGLLLIYHVAIGFQRWGIMIGFIANEKSWDSLWIPMSMLNVWRIPLLFFVSGMGVYFALQKRNWKELFAERGARILLPFIAGIFLIVPIHVLIWREYYNMELVYTPNPGHLWFLGNIFAYVILLSPLFFYLKNNSEGKVAVFIRKMFSSPLSLIIVIAAFVLEVVLVDPRPYELYAMTWHGFFMGMLAFFFGFCFVLSGQPFLDMMIKWRWLFLAVAVGMFAYRFTKPGMFTDGYLLVIESQCWIFSVLAFGNKYLNRNNNALKYLSQAAYPVYIVHMIFLYLASLLIFPLNIPVQIQFLLVLLLTAAGCFAFFEMIRRVKYLRPLFGLKLKEAESLKLKAEIL